MMSEQATTPPGALLFDLDGTLIDTDPLHAAVFRELFAERGITIDHAFYLAHVHGRLNGEIFAEHFPDEDPVVLSEHKEATFRARLNQSVPPTPGLSDLLDRAADAGLAIAAVTNAPRDNAHVMLDAIGMRHRFPLLVIGDECIRGKPHPDPYLEAMRRLAVTPQSSIAFEDSPSGLRAASAAGAYCVGLRSSLDESALRSAGADAVISDFTDPLLETVIVRQTGLSL